MNIAIANSADAEIIFQLQRLAYQSEAELYQDWNLPPLTETLPDLLGEFERQTFFKAVEGDSARIVGSVRAQVQEGVCLIGRLIVHPQFQHQGIGSALLRQAEGHFAQARCFELFTGHRSVRNLSLYQHWGYVPFREQQVSAGLRLIFLRKPSAGKGRPA